jgi:hypothetical protein
MGESAFIGGEQARSGEPLDNLSGRLTDGRPPERQTPAAPAPTEVKPDESSSENELFSGYEPHEIESWREQLKNGVRTIEDIRWQANLTDEEVAVLTGGPPASKPAADATNRVSIERELAAIAALRRSDPDKYWRSEALQKKELALIAQRDKAKAEASIRERRPRCGPAEARRP